MNIAHTIGRNSVSKGMVLSGLFTLVMAGWSASYKMPVMAFELALSTDQVLAIFTDKLTDKIAISIIDAMRATTRVDYLFILAYVSFLVVFAYQANQLMPSVWNRLAIGVALLVGLFDVLENGRLFSIMDTVQHQPGGNLEPALHWLSIYTRVKWELSSVLILLVIPFLWRGGYLSKAIAILSSSVSVVGVTALFTRTPCMMELLTQLVILGLLVLIFFVFISAISQRNGETPRWL